MAIQDPEANDKDSTVSNEVETRKRLRHKQEEPGNSPTIEPEAFGETLLKRKNLVPSAEIPLINPRVEKLEHAEAQCSYKEKDGSQLEKGSLVSLSSHHRDEQYLCGQAGNAMHIKETNTEQDSKAVQVFAVNDSSIIPDRPMNETCNATSGNLDGPNNVLAPSEVTSTNSEKRDMSKLASAQEIFSTDVNIASSNTGKENCAPEFSDNNASYSMTKFSLHDNAVIASSPLLDENDIAKGEERKKISLINEFTSEMAPPYFHYIPWNAIYQNAHVKFSLAQIGEEDCCLNCFGNCLSSSIPCSCTRETGGEFVYTPNGLLKKEFLDECFSMSRYPDKHRFYCKDCPIEKLKTQTTDAPDPCKGHLVRKFIKECWSKCGCNKHCGNRVVQRGIIYNLQVFYTNGGKGWGLRTLEELPKGAFVCEFVGEILTNRELYDRTLQRTGHANQTYTVFLDADWCSEEALKDEKALCLDASFYGNVGRFVNHRCSDANLVEIPVEWETPDHHYYHLAYFTSRKIEAMEELTRDYGIDFKNRTHPFKVFKCLCGSRYCRGSFRSKTRCRASASK